MDSNSFDRLLQFLDTDREAAGSQYELIRRKLIRLFQWRDALDPESLADRTLEEVGARLKKGAELRTADPFGYFAGVAHLVYKEILREMARSRAAAEANEAMLVSLLSKSKDETNIWADFAKNIVKGLASSDLGLLEKYYQQEGPTEARLAKVADDLGSSPSLVAAKIQELTNDLVGRVEAEIVHGPDKSRPLVTLDVVDFELYKALHRHPELLRTLPWRAFERLLADILETFGYEIELHQGTKDGGIDIVAVKREDTFGLHRYILQAKRWNNKVGVEPVRQILFLHNNLRATKSCLATTASFTKGAWDLSRQYCWQLELRDGGGLYEWIRDAAKLKYGLPKNP